MTNSTVKWKFLKLNGVMNRKYKVSNEGVIINAKTKQPLKQRNMRKKSPINGSDYQHVYIPGMGKAGHRVHRIVCETFHGVSKNASKNIVNHIDEFKNNNEASNLEWVTSSVNSKKYWANHPRKTFSASVIKQTKTLINKGWSNDRIAQKMKMSDSNVSAIKVGKIHKASLPAITDCVKATIRR